jgi:hypothetical protein
MARTFTTWKEVGDFLHDHGVSTVYIKQLAPKQDNDKNQIYLARQKGANPFALVERILPLTFGNRASSTSSAKRKSQAGTPILEGTVPWNWVDRDGTPHPAPKTRAIFYLQYPEVRLSGFLTGCDLAPDSLRRSELSRFGCRALAFGTGRTGEVYGLVLTELEDPALFRILPGSPKSGITSTGLSKHPRNPVFYYFEVVPDALDKLLDDLRSINKRGWHPSQRLKKEGETPIPFRGTQGGGYTLEALLGIPSNANKNGDRDGIEVKSFAKAKVSLMTPVPDGGIQGNLGLLSFLTSYGYVDLKDPTCLLFNGTHHFGKVQPKTKLKLTISGYDSVNGFTGLQTDVVVSLVDHHGNCAASWSYIRLFESWNKKHANAVYVASEKRLRPGDPVHDADYRFGTTIWVCEGTSSRHLLDAIIDGAVVDDPGDTSKSGATGKPKSRPQWRVKSIKSLKNLYDSVKKLSLP